MRRDGKTMINSSRLSMRLDSLAPYSTTNVTQMKLIAMYSTVCYVSAKMYSRWARVDTQVNPFALSALWMGSRLNQYLEGPIKLRLQIIQLQLLLSLGGFSQSGQLIASIRTSHIQSAIRTMPETRPICINLFPDSVCIITLDMARDRDKGV